MQSKTILFPSLLSHSIFQIVLTCISNFISYTILLNVLTTSMEQLKAYIVSIII